MAGIRCGGVPHIDRDIESGSDVSLLIPAWTLELEDRFLLFYERLTNFIPQTVIDWLQEHEYSKEYNVGVPYLQQSSRYIEALEVFKSATTFFSSGGNKEGFS